MKILLVVTENKECPFLTSPNECEFFLFKRSIFAQYTMKIRQGLEISNWSMVVSRIGFWCKLSIDQREQIVAWIRSHPHVIFVCAQIVDFLYKYTVFRAKKSEVRPIRPIPNVHVHMIGIVFSSSKPIGIEYCFDDV